MQLDELILTLVRVLFLCRIPVMFMFTNVNTDKLLKISIVIFPSVVAPRNLDERKARIPSVLTVCLIVDFYSSIFIKISFNAEIGVPIWRHYFFPRTKKSPFSIIKFNVYRFFVAISI